MFKSKIRVEYIFIASIILYVLIFLFSLSVGGSSINVSSILNSIFNPSKVENLEQVNNIVMNVRLPRTIVTMMVGGCLAVSGVMIQAVLKNPLADTGILGIQAGATIAALSIMLIFPILSPFLPIFSFIGGILIFTILIICNLKMNLRPIKLILSGVAMNSLLGAIIGLITIFNSDKIENALSWLNGSFANIDVSNAQTILFYGTIALIISLLLIPKCNLLLLDDDLLVTLGVNVLSTRLIVASVAVFLSALSVSVVGIIGFIGLVVPHIGRMFVGGKHQQLIPFSFLLGGVLTTSSDMLQRFLFSPLEIPAGIIISFVGAIFFFGFLLKGDKI